MNARFRPSSAGQVDGAAGLFDATAQPGPSVSLSGQACCCVARAVVRVVMPPTAARPHETEVLLCGHHYRASRTALAVAGAVARALLDPSGEVAAWIGASTHAAG